MRPKPESNIRSLEPKFLPIFFQGIEITASTKLSAKKRDFHMLPLPLSLGNVFSLIYKEYCRRLITQGSWKQKVTHTRALRCFWLQAIVTFKELFNSLWVLCILKLRGFRSKFGTWYSSVLEFSVLNLVLQRLHIYNM